MKKLFFISLTILSTFTVAATDYDQLQAKASRFYQYKEWPSALAMYQLMIDSRPSIPSNYCHAIVAAGLSDNKDAQITYLRKSMDVGIPLDSIYNGVQSLAFAQGQAPVYENFLDNVSTNFPWLERNILGRLIDYYCWRNDADAMIAGARKMLRAIPDDIKFLTVLADGYFMNNMTTDGINVYRNILALDPDNYHALLVLGNYYADIIATNRFDNESPVLARQYLSRAYAIAPTPYIRARLVSLPKSHK